MHYKFLKKLIGAFGFKLVDKKLIKNERLLSSYSSLNINKILESFFLTNKIKQVIQIGANDGERFDELNSFIKKYEPHSIFIEPIKANFEDLKKNYQSNDKFIFENVAISVNNEIKKLYKVKENKLNLYDEHVVGITSFDYTHLIKHGVKKSHIETEDVSSISIHELIKKYDIKSLDLLMIDTEGYDSKIVQDFLKNSELRPAIIFEYIHSNNIILGNVLELLKKKNYIILKVNENIFCYPNEIRNKLTII